MLRTALCALLWTLAAVGATEVGSTYDFIVIGGGTAGLVVASRLAEANATVAVIEAGQHHINDPLIDIPHNLGIAQGNPNYDWNFNSTPQAGLDGLVLPLARGKMLGGSSGLNYMAWLRASEPEYDAWEQLGNPGWNWDNLEPYFKITETVQPPNVTIDTFPGIPDGQSIFNPTLHGTSGPVQVSEAMLFSNVTPSFVESLNKLGIPTNPEPYGGNATGIFNAESSIDIKTGTRSYAANAYYQQQANLQVFLGTQATKILFQQDSSPLKATAVQVHSNGTSMTLTARNEVILAAGVYQSPQLLELSGIGNKTLLSNYNIACLYDLPAVGENQQDQVFIPMDWQLNDAYTTFDEATYNATYLHEQEVLYNTTHTGLLATAFGGIAYTPFADVAWNGSFAPVLQRATQMSQMDYHCPLFQKQYEIQAEWLSQGNVGDVEFIQISQGGFTPIPPSNNTDYLTMYPTIIHPFSRGSVHITSGDPLSPPAIDPAFLAEDIDADILVASAQFGRQLMMTAPIGPNVVTQHAPPANVTSDAALLSYGKTALGTLHHGIGTCAMAPEGWGGVVNPELIVYGTSNLRVIDASIFPLQIAAHPQATVYAVAERAVAMMIEQYGL